MIALGYSDFAVVLLIVLALGTAFGMWLAAEEMD